MSEPVIVKVFNLTDVATPNLAKYRLQDQHIAIGNRMCAPGEYVEQEDGPTLRETCRHLVAVGALAIGALPPPYVAARSAASEQLSAHIQHLDVKETKVVDVPQAPYSNYEQAGSDAPAEAAIESPKSAKPKK